jgi:uncharacterized protein (DUF1810 family)
MVFAVQPNGAIHLTKAEWDGTPMSQNESNRFDLNRFVSAQEGVFEVALAELRRGQKRSHWMWFIFPQLAGLGYSSTSRKYAIKSLDEARAYLAHPVLGQRLLDCCRAILSVQGRSASEIMGYPDDLKLRSSITLFVLAADSHPEFRQVLDRYFGGQLDPRTLDLLHVQP